MTKSNILFIGMDVHKESIEIALADDGANGEVRRYGRIGGTRDALKKTLRKLVSEDKTLHFCYEAGPCSSPSSRARNAAWVRSRTPSFCRIVVM